MVEKLHSVVLVGGEIGFGKTTALERVIGEVSSVNVIGFVQPSIYDQKQGDQVNQEKSSHNSQQIKIVNIEQHRTAIEIHFLTKLIGENEEKKIFKLATLNPEFNPEDTVSIMSENMKAKKPKQPRWIFNNEVFGQISQLLEEKLQSLMKENRVGEKILIVVDELGWLEMEGKGYVLFELFHLKFTFH